MLLNKVRIIHVLCKVAVRIAIYCQCIIFYNRTVGIYSFIANIIRERIGVFVTNTYVKILPARITLIGREVKYNACMVYPYTTFVSARIRAKERAFVVSIVIIQGNGYIGLSEEPQTSRISRNRTQVATQCAIGISHSFKTCRTPVVLL